MNFKNSLLFTAMAFCLFSACKKDDNNPKTNIDYNILNANSNYFTTFQDADGKTTVDISGQTTRRLMLKEMDAYMRTATSATIDANKLQNMFANANNPFTDADLNSASTKTLIAKTAQSFSASAADAERQRFNGYFTSLAQLSTQNMNTANAGSAGVLTNGSRKYLVNAMGWEYGQLIQKGLIGAVMLDQISNIYLGATKQSADNQNIETGTNYTPMAHHWDEAYGYLTPNPNYPMADPNTAGKFLESYLGDYVRQVNTNSSSVNVTGNPSEVFLAFLKGRAAIVNNDMATKNQQITSINTALEKAIAQVAISYLNKAEVASNDGARSHSLSEGVGFIYSLRYAANAKVNTAKSDAIMNNLMNKQPNGFWSLTPADLKAARHEIAQVIGVSEDALVNH